MSSYYTTTPETRYYAGNDYQEDNGGDDVDRPRRSRLSSKPANSATLQTAIQKGLTKPFKWVPWVMFAFYLSGAITVFVTTGLDTFADAAVVEDRIGQNWWWANKYRVTYWFASALVINALIQAYHYWKRGDIISDAGLKLRINTLPLDFAVLSAVSQFLLLCADQKGEEGTLLFGSMLNLTGALLTGLIEWTKTLWTRKGTEGLGAEKRAYMRATQSIFAIVGGLLQCTPIIWSLIWFSVGCSRGYLNCVTGMYVYVIGVSTCMLLRIILQVWSCFTANNLGYPVYMYWLHQFFQIAIVCITIPTMRNTFTIKDQLVVPNL